MKYHKISLAGMSLGFIIAFLAIIRWAFIYQDYSEVASWVIHGLIIMVIFYLYNLERNRDEYEDSQRNSNKEELRKVNERFDFLNKRLDALYSVATHTEKEHVEGEIKNDKDI